MLDTTLDIEQIYSQGWWANKSEKGWNKGNDKGSLELVVLM